jgi:hypothetical protein
MAFRFETANERWQWHKVSEERGAFDSILDRVFRPPIIEKSMKEPSSLSLLWQYSDGGSESAPVPLGPNVALSIGRSPNSDVRVPDTTVSNAHAQLWADPEDPTVFILKDYSKNGTKVNTQNGPQMLNQREARLPVGTSFQIGPMSFTVN